MQTYKKLAEQFLQNRSAVTLAAIQQVKLAELRVNTGRLTAELMSVFSEMKKSVNRESAYWMNGHVDIVWFVEDRGYVKKHGTERWPRYEKGDEIFLVTDGNTLYNPKTGKNTNLYDFIQEHYPKLNPKVSNTKHMVDTVMQTAGLQIFSKPLCADGGMHGNTPNIAGGVKKFSADDYRIETLNTYKNCLLTRGITPDTLQNPLFAGTIVQGNKTGMDGRYHNVIYPFKSHPAHRNGQMLTLLQQYGKKIDMNGKMTDKIFAEGSGKNRSLWFSRIPEKAKRMYIFENPLDALSHYQTYHPLDALYAATGGNPAQGQYQKITEVCRDLKIQPVLCFDNDFAGCRFDTSYMASVRPERLSVEKTGEDFYHVKLSRLNETEMKNIETVLEAKGISVISRGNNELVAGIDSLEKAAAFNDFISACIVKTDAKTEKSVMKDFNDDLVNHLSKQYGSMDNSRKMSF